MSAGNIYRFYKSKLDIAEAIGRQSEAETSQRFAELVRETGKSAAERLNLMFSERMQKTYLHVSREPKILEIIQVLTDQRPDFAEEMLLKERIYIVQILKQGVASGEFSELADTDVTAELLQTAFIKFMYPQLWKHTSIEKLESEFQALFELLAKALRQNER